MAARSASSIPHGDELDQPGARRVEHAERAVPGVDQLGRGGDDALQDRRQARLGGDQQHGVQQPAQLRLVRPARSVHRARG